ncbi:MAG: 50S ribosomal protein L6 [Candidatus Omnitrophota bacterium]
MSRIGKKAIVVPNEVKVEITKESISATGPKGKSQIKIPPGISVSLDSNKLVFSRATNTKPSKSLHGLTRSLAFNMIEGVKKGFVKELEIVGVGFRAQIQGKTLVMMLGFTHAVNFPIPDDIKILAPKQTQIVIEGIDKFRVGQVAAQIRDIFPPEPYKGKGIRYVGEYVRRKVGKVVAK